MRWPQVELSPRWRWILFVAVLLACSIRYLARAELCLDDAFIYLDLARNWVAGHGPRFNPGDSHLPASSPAWVAMLAASKAVLPGVGWEPLSVGLTFVLLVAACVPLHLLLAKRHPLAAVLAPIAIFCTPSILSLCGHDTTFATAAGLWLLWARQAQRWKLLGPLAALFYLGRAEGAVLGAAVLGSAALARGWRPRAVREQLRALSGGLAVGLLLALAWHGYFYLEFGKIVPATVATKLAHAHSGWPTFAARLPSKFEGSLGLWWLAAPGLLGLLLHAPGLVAWAVLHCSLLALSGIAAYHWYYYPLELVLLAGNLVGLDLAAALLLLLGRRLDARPALLATLTCACVVAASAVAWLAYPREQESRESLLTRRDTYFDASQWLSAQARLLALQDGRRPRLLTDEIGTLAFYLPEFEVRDTVGLALPLESLEDVQNLPRAVARTHPDFLLLPGAPDRTEMLVPEPDGWQVFPFAYQPKPGLQGRLVFTGRSDQVPEGSGARRALNLARLTQQPLEVTGELAPIDVPGVGIGLMAHAPSRLRFDLPGREATRVLLGFGLADGSWQDGNATDGVLFALEAVDADGRVERVFTSTLRPLTVPADRGLHGAEVALPVGTRSLLLVTENAGEADWDWSYWAGVMPR